MNLELITPTGSQRLEGLLEIGATGPMGKFCLLPRHIDFVSTLRPGLVSYKRADGSMAYAVIGEGILVKRGPEVLVSTGFALAGSGSEALLRAAAGRAEADLECESSTRARLSMLEAEFMRRLKELA